MDPKELVMKVVEVLGAEVVIAILSDDQALSMISQFLQAVGQLQPEQRQQLAQVVQQMAQQGSGNAAQENPDAQRQQAMYGQQEQSGGFV